MPPRRQPEDREALQTEAPPGARIFAFPRERHRIAVTYFQQWSVRTADTGAPHRSELQSMNERTTTGAGEQEVQYFNRWAETYDRSILQRIFFTRIHARMLKLLDRETAAAGAPECFVDVGCGTGRLLDAASARWPAARMLGADPAERMVEELRRIRPGLEVVLASAESLPFPDESADIVVSSLSFHHWADQALGIREIARVLRAGGSFCLTDHTFLPARLFAERPQTRRRVRMMMEDAGLTVRKQRWICLPFILVTLARK